MFPGPMQAAILGGRSIAPPPSLSGLSLVNWFDPRLGTYQDDALTTPATTLDAVGGLADQLNPATIAATQSTGTKRPTIQLNSAGQKVLRFDGTDDDLLTGSLGSISQPYTIATILMLRSNPTSSTARALRQATNWQFTVAQNTFAVNMSAGSNVALGNLALNTPVVLLGAFNGASSVGNLGGVETTGNPASGAAGGVIALASTETGLSGFLGCDMGPVLRYSGAADASQRASLVTWLRAATGW
jgi:hypothetical protein